MALVNWPSTLTFFVFIMITIPISTTSTPVYADLCPNDATYEPTSRYSDNLNTLFRSLVSNAATNPTGFFSTSAGGGTQDAVYGVFLCRGDLTTAQCHDCVTTAVREQPDKTKTSCHQKKAVTMWYDECMVRYDNLPIQGRLSSVDVDVIANPADTPGDDQDSFVQLLGTTMHELAARAASGPPQAGKYYAEIVVSYNSTLDPLLYCMAQCTPDLSVGDCNRCFLIVVPQLPTKLGGRVLHPNCNVRFEVYPFLNNGGFNFSAPKH